MGGAMRAADGSSLRFRLRRSTAAAHQQLEDLIGIDSRCRDRDRYRDLLAMFWGFYAPLEAALAQIDWRGTGLDFAERRKLPWLTADLIALGWSSTRIAALPQASLGHRPEGLADGLGVLYVLEGSTLGGQTIVPIVQEALGLSPECGARFFSSYGPEVGRMWRGYVAALEGEGANPQTAERIEQSALLGFESLMGWAADCSISAVNGRDHVH